MTSQKIERLVRPLAIKAMGDDGSFEGYGSVFDVVDSYREAVLPGAFKQSLDTHKEKGTMPALLWQHKSDAPIGVWNDMEEDDHGLKMSGRLVLETQQGREAHALLKAGAVRGLSIGFSLYPGGSKFNEKTEVVELSNINLWETSVVTFPANTEAQVTDVRAALDEGTYPTIRQFEKWLRDAGFSRKDAETISVHGFAAITRDADTDLMKAIENNINILNQRARP